MWRCLTKICACCVGVCLFVYFAYDRNFYFYAISIFMCTFFSVDICNDVTTHQTTPSTAECSTKIVESSIYFI